MKSTEGENSAVSEAPDGPVASKINNADVSNCSTDDPGESLGTDNTVESAASKPTSPTGGSWNSGKCRKPNWTDIEVRTLILEYDRFRDVMVSKAAYDSDGHKKPKGEKQKVWRVITEAVNRSQVESVNLLGNTAVERTLKDVIKKWVNLVNKMKCDFATKRDNPNFIPCPTSLAINTILFTNDPLDLDVLPVIVRPKTETPTPPRSGTPVLPETTTQTKTPVQSDTEKPSRTGVPGQTKEILVEVLPETSVIRTKYREIAPHPGVDNTMAALPKADNSGDNTQTQESLRQAILKRKASEIESATDIKSPGNHRERKLNRRRKDIHRPRIDSTSECNGNDLNIKQEIIHHENNTMQIRFSLDNDSKPSNTQKNMNDTINTNEMTNSQKESKESSKGLISDVNKVSNHAQNFVPLYNNNTHEHNGVEGGPGNHIPEFYNGDMYTDDFMQLNKEVLELKKHKLLMKINKLALERDKATNDKIRSEIEKDTARMINRKVHLELEKFEKSLEK